MRTNVRQDLPPYPNFLSAVETQLVNAASPSDIVDARKWVNQIVAQYNVPKKSKIQAEIIIKNCEWCIENQKSLPCTVRDLYTRSSPKVPKKAEFKAVKL